MEAIKNIEKISNELANELKTEKQFNPYSYMILTSVNFYSLIFNIFKDVEEEGFDYSFRDDFIDNINNLSEKEMKKLIKLFLMEYFSFAKGFMRPEFIKYFPVPFNDFEKGFKTHMKLSTKDKKEFKKIVDSWGSNYHSIKTLEILKFPSDADNGFFIDTITEVKIMLFHQMNKNLNKILLARRKVIE